MTTPTPRVRTKGDGLGRLLPGERYTPRQVESETMDGQDASTPAEVPVPEGQPQSPQARPRRRTQEPTTEAVALPNPDCTNPACVVTCSPQCPNLIEEKQWREYAESDISPYEEGVVTSRRLPA